MGMEVPGEKKERKTKAEVVGLHSHLQTGGLTNGYYLANH